MLQLDSINFMLDQADLLGGKLRPVWVTPFVMHLAKTIQDQNLFLNFVFGVVLDVAAV